MLARPEGSHSDWRRVGRHRRTGKFYWYGTDYSTALRHKGKLSGSMEKNDENIAAFQKWARRRGLVVKTEVIKESRRKQFVAFMKSEIGTTEVPLGSNRGPRVDWYRKATTLWPSMQSGWPWCAAFVVRGLLEAGYDLDNDLRTASVANFTAAARKRGAIVSRKPKAGDVVVLLGPGKHIGGSLGGSQTVEGNTTPDGMYGSQYEGTAVARKDRSDDDIIFVIDPDKLVR